MKRTQLALASALVLAFSPMAIAQQDQQGGQAPQAGAQATNSALSPEVVKQVQQKLNEQGFHAGPVDGNWGEKTQSALKNFQKSKGMQASGNIDPQTMSALGIQSAGGAQAQGGQSQGGQSQAQGGDPMQDSQGQGGATAQNPDSGSGSGQQSQ